jgi:RND family efflux transporter MFP subunit
MPAQVSVLETGKTYAGKVEAVSAAIDQKTGLIDVKVSVDNSDKTLKSGMQVNVRLTPKDQTRKIYVPLEAVLSPDSNPYVFVIENNAIKQAPVKLGEKKYAYVEVAQGLSADAQVVVQGNDRINENSAFRVVKSYS